MGDEQNIQEDAFVDIIVQTNACLTTEQMTQIDADMYAFAWPDGMSVESVAFFWGVGVDTEWEVTIVIDGQSLDEDEDGDVDAVIDSGILAVVEATSNYQESVIV